MKQKNNEGFSLIEILVGMAILALIVLPTCTGMVMSFRLNAKTNQMLQAQLAVSSAVETLMAEGITEARADYDIEGDGTDRFEKVKINTTAIDGEPYYTVEVKDNEGLVTVKTTIRKSGGG